MTITASNAAGIDSSELHRMAAEIREEIPCAQIHLFGSHARGDARPDSDVDLLITVSDHWYATHDWFETLGRLWNKLSYHRKPLDLLLYPQSKVDERRQWRHHVIAKAYEAGIRLDAQV